jgi:hypothetical protein
MNASVDPEDQPAVARLLAEVVAALGVAGISDLLLRIPGTRLVPATAKRFLTPASPASVWLGTEHQLVLTDPPTHLQSVGGVVLHRDIVLPGELPSVLAPLISRLVHDYNCQESAGAALSAVAEVIDRL